MKTKHLFGGSISGRIFTVNVTPEWMSGEVVGYTLVNLDELVDEGVQWVVFVDPNRGRYTSSIDDWLEYSILEDGRWHLRQSYMTRG